MNYDDCKKKLRRLKRLEIKYRYGSAEPPRGAGLVWDEFFSLKETPESRAKYSLAALGAMAHEAFRAVVGEYLLNLYSRLYWENGNSTAAGFDPALLAELDLPFDADAEAVKHRFHELALQHHPDTGGDAEEFIRLMDNYRKLIGKGG